MKKGRNIFWGLFFIASGAVVVLNQLGYFTNVGMWTLVLTVMIVAIIVQSLIHINFGGIFFSLALLAIIFAKPWGLTAITPWPVLITAAFLTIGLSMIFHRTRYSHRFRHPEGFNEVINEQDDSVVSVDIRFSSSIKYVNSDNFEQANLSCSFGALKVYFDNVTLSKKGAEINLDLSFSGTELYIPKSWKVVNNANIALGGIDEKNAPRHEPDGPTVTIKGNVSFGGVEIIYI